MTKREKAQKQRWMAEFETAVTKERRDLCGKLDWYTAEHLYNQKWTVADAAARYLATCKKA